LAVIQERNNNPEDAVLWVGSEGGMESTIIQRAGIDYTEIPSAGVHGISLAKLPGNIFKLIKGFFASRRILKQFKPDVLFFTGGYVGFPMSLAAIRYPQLLFVPDIEPGIALKVLTRFSDTIAVICEESKKIFPKNKRIAVTGYPTRRDLKSWSPADARKTMNLSSSKPVLFVFGGSKGARSINQAITSNLDNLLSICQIIHITGEPDWIEMQKIHESIDPMLKGDYHITPYLNEEMGAAFCSADLVLSRAGASTIGELPLFGLPAILVPYPYAWRYQKVNADYLSSKGAAIVIQDEELKDSVVSVIQDLMKNREKLTSMRKKMSALAVHGAARNIALLLEELSLRKK
jgi:UDP-N-acetylglucosamine--N-acetylmuramyl-(pentapeptide) pyrophosphoryl-undecaprenol N-acetylglucosamine transferase